MKIQLLSLLINIIPVGILCALAILVPLRRIFGNGGRACACALFTIYLLAVYSLTGIPAINGLVVDPSFNLVPLAGLSGDAKNAALNILLFIPMGVFLPILWKEFHSLPRTMLAGLGVSLAIEMLQIFTFRLTDVNDLLTNVMGTLLGALAAKLLLKRGIGREGKHAAPELPLLLGLSFGMAFLVQPYISSIFWNVIYK